jgi:NAD(P)-dependent dehydrogenase (short-subunit alcohol dehydrogenase family)
MGQSILITGAGTRVGKALATGLAADGWQVCIHYNRSASPAQALADEIEGNGGSAVIVKANLNVPDELETLVGRASEALGEPGAALNNNAATFSPDQADDFTNAVYAHHMDVNLKAPLRLAYHFANQLPDDATGVIINMIDQRVLKPNPEFFTYALSKAALFAATKTLAQALAPRIRVNGIGPGPTLQSIHQTAEEFKDELDRTLLKTGSPPETLLDGIRYLLSATSVTGQMIAIDGGQHLNF